MNINGTNVKDTVIQELVKARKKNQVAREQLAEEVGQNNNMEKQQELEEVCDGGTGRPDKTRHQGRREKHQ